MQVKMMLEPDSMEKHVLEVSRKECAVINLYQYL